GVTSRTRAAPPRTSRSSPHDGELLADRPRREGRAGRAGEAHHAVRPDPLVGPREQGDLVGAGSPLEQVAALGPPFHEHLVVAPHERDVLAPRDAPDRRDEPLEPLPGDMVGHDVLETRGGWPLARRIAEREGLADP